jgi:hypothetical protein
MPELFGDVVIPEFTAPGTRPLGTAAAQPGSRCSTTRSPTSTSS